MCNDRDNFNSKEFGKKIKIARKNMKYTQSKLAEMLNLSNNYISDIERGVKIPPIPTLINIMNCLKMNPIDLFNPWVQYCVLNHTSDLSKRVEELTPIQQVLVNTVIESMIKSFKTMNQ